MDEYEKWHPKAPPKSYSMNYVGVATGYLMGHTTTLTMQLYAASHTDAMRMFTLALESAGLVNLSAYNVVRKDV